jgi:hypothetical protein
MVPGRPKPFAVQRYVDGKDKTEFFSTATDRDARATAFREALRKGELVQVPGREEAGEWAAFKAAVGNTQWQDVVAGWRRDMQSSGKSVCELTVAKACAQFLADEEDQLKAGRLSLDTMRHKRQIVGAFSTAFGANKLDQVSGEDIEVWLDDDVMVENGNTFDGWRRHIRTLYSEFAKQVRDNPCDDIELRGGATEYVNILSVRDTARLFAYALDHERGALGRLALEAFAGLRFGSSTRLEKADIHANSGGTPSAANPARNLMSAARASGS